MTQIERARKGKITSKMKKVASFEGLSGEFIAKGVSEGSIVIPSSRLRKTEKLCGIGEGLRTKVNANIGTSPGHDNTGYEIKKLEIATKAGADTVMDLSTGRHMKRTRRAILERSRIPVGTVPIYEVASMAFEKRTGLGDITTGDILDCLNGQALEGVDFFTIHAGVTRNAVKILFEEGRLMDIVSRGGAILANWMLTTGMENPLYEHFDDVLEISKRYDITLSLGDGMRPGCIKDAGDGAQIEELVTLGQLAKRAKAKGVQAMIEGPGHVPINEIETNVRMEKSLCDNAPFYVLGPLVTDIASGYDHITAAIGGAIAAASGADFLCYVTPSEHLRLPSAQDVKEGVIASKIAAHAADIAKHVKDAGKVDDMISRARKERDWETQLKLSIDPSKSRSLRKSSKPLVKDVCTMCDRYCALKIFDEITKKAKTP